MKKIPTMYCPVCGEELDSYRQVIKHKMLDVNWVDVTCRTAICKVFNRTIAADHVAEGLDQWHTKQYFDVNTGEHL